MTVRDILPRLFLFFALLAGVSGCTRADPTIVIVHGAWGGGWAFTEVADRLEDRGFRVYRPTLTGLGERHHLRRPDTGLDTHVQDIVSMLEFEGLEDVMLVGHSYGGIVISGVANEVPERIRKLVFLDALLLEDGESWFEIQNEQAKQWFLERLQDDSLVPPWVKPGQEPPSDVPHPAKTYRDELEYDNPDALNLPATYILTADDADAPERDNFWAFSRKAVQRGWSVRVLEADHNPQWSNVDGLVGMLAEEAGTR